MYAAPRLFAPRLASKERQDTCFSSNCRDQPQRRRNGRLYYAALRRLPFEMVPHRITSPGSVVMPDEAGSQSRCLTSRTEAAYHRAVRRLQRSGRREAICCSQVLGRPCVGVRASTRIEPSRSSINIAMLLGSRLERSSRFPGPLVTVPAIPDE